MSCKKEPFLFNLSQLRMLGKDCKIAKKATFCIPQCQSRDSRKKQKYFSAIDIVMSNTHTALRFFGK